MGRVALSRGRCRAAAHRAGAFALVAALAGCTDRNGEAGGAPADETVERVVDAVIELSVGLADGDTRYVFGSIGGIAVDAGGRIHVADGRNHEIRVYDADGVFLSSFGRFGDGPGDLLNPCCVAFDAAGRLWVWNAAETLARVRYDVFDVSRERALHRLRLRVLDAGIGTLLTRRPIFHPAGGVVHVTSIEEHSADWQPARIITTPGGGTTLLPPTGEQRTRVARVHLDTTGAELGRTLLRHIPPDSLGSVRVTTTAQLGGATGRVPVWLALPGSAVHLTAHSPHGGFVDAVSSRYEIFWYRDDGSLARITSRKLAGPLLSRDERVELRNRFRAQQARARGRGGELPEAPIPERRHPLQRLFFDDDGRLWVQRTPGGVDEFEHADVHLPDGTYLHTVRWPRGIRLDRGALSGDVAYGVAFDEFDVPRLVRLRIAEPR